jgi:N-acetyl-gamma-glutamyl-phosphate reductase
MKTAILGATGYTGMVLLRLLGQHPQVRDIMAVSSSQPGTKVRDFDAGLPPGIEDKMGASGGMLATMASAVSAAEAGALDVVFSALPHLKSAELCAPLFGKTVVIDLSADFRLHDPAVFQSAYGAPMPNPALRDKAVYGLSEWHTESIRMAGIIAVPGCYPTATLLPLLPLAREKLLQGTVIVNAISGISGAGRKEKIDLLFCERAENVNAYNAGTSHRHAPEISQELVAAHGGLSLLFTPHMAPLRRGMAVTTVAELSREPASSGPESVEGVFRKYYGDRPFIGLVGDTIPQTRHVCGSNRCDIGWKVQGKHVMLFSVIDNLVKGASGMAVQDMNIRFGLPETAGLPLGAEL